MEETIKVMAKTETEEVTSTTVLLVVLLPAGGSTFGGLFVSKKASCEINSQTGII
jgi:hypothetical protein